MVLGFDVLEFLMHLMVITVCSQSAITSDELNQINSDNNRQSLDLETLVVLDVAIFTKYLIMFLEYNDLTRFRLQ